MDTTSGDCVVAAGSDVIVVPAGNYVLTVSGNNEDNNTKGDLDIRAGVTISGAGAGQTIISGGSAKRTATTACCMLQCLV